MLRFFRKCFSVTTALITLTLLLEASPCTGQTNRGMVTATIPFGFTLGNLTLPAGSYVITREGLVNLRISGPHNHGLFVQTHGEEGKAPEGKGRLVFHRYGTSYFLSDVWFAADHTGRRVFPSPAEKKLAARSAEREVAVLRIVE